MEFLGIVLILGILAGLIYWGRWMIEKHACTCPKCGGKYRKLTPQNEKRDIFCPHCGALLRKG